jgi:hypothetical protein
MPLSSMQPVHLYSLSAKSIVIFDTWLRLSLVVMRHLLRAKANRPCTPTLAQKRPPEGIPSALYYPSPVCAVARLVAYYFD